MQLTNGCCVVAYCISTYTEHNIMFHAMGLFHPYFDQPAFYSRQVIWSIGTHDIAHVDHLKTICFSWKHTQLGDDG